jgi:hypothetical protein
MRAQFGLESIRGIPGVVVRDLGAEVVGHMGLSDAVKKEAVDVAVHRAEGSTLEVKRSVSVVWEQRVRVLEEGNHDEPVLKKQKKRHVQGVIFFFC